MSWLGRSSRGRSVPYRRGQGSSYDAKLFPSPFRILSPVTEEAARVVQLRETGVRAAVDAIAYEVQFGFSRGTCNVGRSAGDAFCPSRWWGRASAAAILAARLSSLM